MMRTLLILVGTINLLFTGCQTATKKTTCGSACGTPCGQCATACVGVANVNTQPAKEVVQVESKQKIVVETAHTEPKLPLFDSAEKNPFEEADDSEIIPEPKPQPQQIKIPKPQRSHGKNYQWLVGTLQRVHTPKHQWKIRYADLDQHDKWGGSVILAPDARLDEWNDGDMVYVEGEVLTSRPSLYLTGALYRIHCIRPASSVTQIIPR